MNLFSVQKTRLFVGILCAFFLSFAAQKSFAGEAFWKGGQQGWWHDDGLEGGFFHTYDNFNIAGVGDISRKVHIFLPRDYEKSGERYPVVYFNDGQTAFYKGGIGNKSLNVASTVSQLYHDSKLRHVIVVAVTPLNRDAEYTHEPVMGQACCGLERYTQYMADHVKPFIDSNYRTLSAPEQTLIAGSSHGGLAAFYIATRRPDQFGNVLSQSGSFWVGLDSSAIGAYLKPLKNSSLLKMANASLSEKRTQPKIYMDWGLVRNGGFHNSFIEERATARSKELANLLQDKYGYINNVDLLTVEDPSGEHEENSWARRLGFALQFFFPVTN